MGKWTLFQTRIALCSAAIAAIAVATSPAAAQQRTFQFDVPAGDLGSSLRGVARTSHQQIAFDARAVRGKKAPALRGRYSAEEALSRVLNGSGLSVQVGHSGLLIIGAATAVSGTGAAQSEPLQREPISDGENADQGKDDIVVTAQKRAERLSDVPIAVTAISGKTLDDQRIQSLQDVSRLTPGLTIAAFNLSNPTVSIRGATNTFSQIGVDKPVAVVIDDVFITRISAYSFDLFDLDSVEVLRGPQGTLFGRNVTGGAILINTRKPSFDKAEFAGSATYGNYNDVELNGLVSGPVTEDVAVKAVVSYRKHDGFGYDRITGLSEDNPESISARTQLRTRLTETLQNLISLDYSNDTNGGRTLSSKGVGNDGNRRTSELGVPQNFERHIYGISDHLDLDVLGGTLTSISAYRNSRAVETYSSTGIYYGLLTTGTQGYVTDGDHVGTFTQELRYASPKWSFGDFVVGGFFLDETASRQLYTQSLAARTGAITSNTLADQHVHTTSYSGFIDGNINLPLNFKLTLGGRYTHDGKDGDLIRTDFITARNSFSTGDFGATFEKFTPRVVLSWKPAPSYLIYGSWTRGFTSGGFNSEATTVASAITPFNPENVNNYEVGAKANWLNGRVTANLAAFEERYTDKQEFVFNTITRIGTILNASRAQAKGIEFEIGLRPVKGLSLDGSYGLLHTRYIDFLVPGVLDNTGHPLALSPRNKASAAVNYEVPVENAGKLIFNASYAYTDSYYTGATMDPNLFIPSYSLVNANIGFETRSGVRLTVWGKNIFNKDYLLTPSTSGILSEYLGAPRTYGVTASARF